VHLTGSCYTDVSRCTVTKTLKIKGGDAIEHAATTSHQIETVLNLTENDFRFTQHSSEEVY